MDFDTACQVLCRKGSSLFSEACRAILSHAKHGLSSGQTAALAVALAESGDKLDLSSDNGKPRADCPSTGGPASLSTLLCPLLLASVGVEVPKLSATGSVAGAIDTMAVIPGFDYSLKGPTFRAALCSAGIAHAQQTDRFCPADRALIECRREQNMMSNRWLAAASLLAKKLIVPGTAAAFDFRVGDTGNIGKDLHGAQQSADVFYKVAKTLDIPIAIVFTDNTSFPCSALGRLESLELLGQILTGEEMRLELDGLHVSTCIRIAAEACVVSGKSATLTTAEQLLRENLESGNVLNVFARHLRAQGTTLKAFEQVIQVRNEQRHIVCRAPRDGFWVPPTMSIARRFAKNAQILVGGEISGCEDVMTEKQVGVRILVSPGADVKQNQPVVEVRCPPNTDLALGWECLSGTVVDEPVLTGNRGVIEGN